MLELVRELMNDYAREGFVTTTVVLVPQNLKQGTLVLGVQWGKVKGWRFDGHEATGMSEHATLAMLPRVEGDLLNIRAVDQAVESLNNGRQQATVDIVPADETGYSWLDVRLHPRLPVSANIGLDNSGTSIKSGDGRLRTTVGATARGFGADVWSMGATRRHYYDGYEASEDSRNLSVSMPLGFWDMELRHGDSRYQRIFRSGYGGYDSSGESVDQNLKIGRTLSRSKRGKTDMTLRIQRKDNENFINDARLEVNSKVYTDLVLGVSRVDQVFGGSFYADASWSRGTRWLGANDVTINAEGHTPALYYKYAGNVSWTRGFGTRRMDYSLRGGWQYTPRKLLTANKLTVGDEYSVRGFKGDSVFGDKGAYLSNTLNVPIAAGFVGFVGADVGVVQDNVPDAKKTVVSSWAVGVSGSWRNASITLTHAAPIKSPYPTKGDVLYAMASLRF